MFPAALHGRLGTSYRDHGICEPVPSREDLVASSAVTVVGSEQEQRCRQSQMPLLSRGQSKP